MKFIIYYLFFIFMSCSSANNVSNNFSEQAAKSLKYNIDQKVYEYLIVLKDAEKAGLTNDCLDKHGLLEFKKISKKIYFIKIYLEPDKSEQLIEKCENIKSIELNSKVKLVTPI